MKGPTSKSNFLAQGFSKTRFLLVVLLAIVLGAGIFFKQRSETLRNNRQAQIERVAQAQLALRNDVQLALTQAKQHLELDNIKGAKKSLRRASILDVIGEFVGQAHELKVQIVQREQTIAQREALKLLALRISASLKAEELSVADSLLQQYLQTVQVEDEVYISLRKQYNRDLQHVQGVETSDKDL